jgi:hypothetical protein
LIADVLKSGGEVDSAGRAPIVLYDALEFYLLLIVGGLGNSNEIKKGQNARNGHEDQKQRDPEYLSHLSLLKSPTRKA